MRQSLCQTHQSYRLNELTGLALHIFPLWTYMYVNLLFCLAGGDNSSDSQDLYPIFRNMSRPVWEVGASTTFFISISCLYIYIHFFTGKRSRRHVCPVFEKPLLGICRRGVAVHEVLAVLQPFHVWEAQVLVPTNVPTPSPCLSLDPTLLGNLGEGVQVEQARELRATLTPAVGIMLPLSELQDVYTNPRALV